MARKLPRKAPVVALRGELRPEVISQSDLQQLEDVQRAVWRLTTQAGVLADNIRRALARGAVIEPGALYYDEDLKMVRSVKSKLG